MLPPPPPAVMRSSPALPTRMSLSKRPSSVTPLPLLPVTMAPLLISRVLPTTATLAPMSLSAAAAPDPLRACTWKLPLPVLASTSTMPCPLSEMRADSLRSLLSNASRTSLNELACVRSMSRRVPSARVTNRSLLMSLMTSPTSSEPVPLPLLCTAVPPAVGAEPSPRMPSAAAAPEPFSARTSIC